MVDEETDDVVPLVAVHRRVLQGESLDLFVTARVSTPRMPGTLFSCSHSARDTAMAEREAANEYSLASTTTG